MAKKNKIQFTPCLIMAAYLDKNGEPAMWGIPIKAGKHRSPEGYIAKVKFRNGRFSCRIKHAAPLI